MATATKNTRARAHPHANRTRAVLERASIQPPITEDNGDGYGYHPTLLDQCPEQRLAQSHTFDHIDAEHYLG